MIVQGLIVFAIAIFVGLFILNSGTRVINVEPRADPTNCQQYYNNFDQLMSCNMHERYDEPTMSCRDYWFVDCGSRFNPELAEPKLLCEPYQNGVSDINMFGVEQCNHLAVCGPIAGVTIGWCVGETYYDLIEKQCLPKEMVECGYRIKTVTD
ncbi:hypothetical protein [Phthorimaea operculella granulovirus]|nr:hypothetical protein [Phthorimaea operculella granulovirus]AAM70269.1 hypothetical protein [Phthorimaea operculella granulovirus]ANY57460.1 hypothetical protein PhopGVgp071 [Phthorimaea operculella granulovirus]QBH65906.1 hypothetical protein PhopGVgp071 [Phthorimaea operculella granulovirus]QBH66036.1 hypothetical protein PhopGVgp071 [Phthorimaea operculella granulovirus]QBH66166.1 hypothetical protein PhopGVgp071 [Phthorimaea operculella granulovirus]